MQWAQPPQAALFTLTTFQSGHGKSLNGPIQAFILRHQITDAAGLSVQIRNWVFFNAEGGLRCEEFKQLSHER